MASSPRGHVGAVLQDVLVAIHGSSLSVRERRRLATSAVHAAFHAGAARAVPPRPAYEAIPELEEVLGVVARSTGDDKLSVSQAKGVLRRHGERGRALASRLGRLSKRRNGQAHPEVGLVDAVRDLLRVGASCEAASAAESDPGPAANLGQQESHGPLTFEDKPHESVADVAEPAEEPITSGGAVEADGDIQFEAALLREGGVTAGGVEAPAVQPHPSASAAGSSWWTVDFPCGHCERVFAFGLLEDSGNGDWLCRSCRDASYGTWHPSWASSSWGNRSRKRGGHR